MTDDKIALRALLEKGSDATFLREMIGFAAERLMALEAEGLCGAGHGERSAERRNHQSRILVVEGGDYYVYAPDGGIFEPYVALGDEVRCGQAAGAVRFPDTP